MARERNVMARKGSMTTLVTLRDGIGTVGLVVCAAGLLAGGYLFLRSLPDIRRYLRISSM
jgi:hypothetical protein